MHFQFGCFIKTTVESGSILLPQTMSCNSWQKLVQAEKETQRGSRYAHSTALGADEL